MYRGKGLHRAPAIDSSWLLARSTYRPWESGKRWGKFESIYCLLVWGHDELYIPFYGHFGPRCLSSIVSFNHAIALVRLSMASA